jgi:hypothetical protein
VLGFLPVIPHCLPLAPLRCEDILIRAHQVNYPADFCLGPYLDAR